MSEINDIRYGYLEAGEKSSPVLIDTKLETGNSKTFYMYNHNSQRIIEYKRDIAESKLRDLNEKEKLLIKELTKGYESARKEFSPRTKGVATIPTSAAASPSKASKKVDQLASVIEPLEEFEIDESEVLELEDDIEDDAESELDIEE